MTTTDFDSAKLDRLREAYGAAVANREAEFTFEGVATLASYAVLLLRNQGRTQKLQLKERLV